MCFQENISWKYAQQGQARISIDISLQKIQVMAKSNIFSTILFAAVLCFAAGVLNAEKPTDTDQPRNENSVAQEGARTNSKGLEWNPSGQDGREAWGAEGWRGEISPQYREHRALSEESFQAQSIPTGSNIPSEAHSSESLATGGHGKEFWYLGWCPRPCFPYYRFTCWYRCWRWRPWF